MKPSILLFGLSLLASGVGAQPVSLSIAEDATVSSDTATICRVTAVNHSGRTLDGAGIGFTAKAYEHGVAVAHARGRFGGVVADGGTVETLIGFTGVYRQFSVEPTTSGRSASPRRGGGKGRSGGKGKGRKKR